MYINHDISIDMVNSGTPPRVYVKQGDVMSRNVRIRLFADGEPWEIPLDAQVVIRYRVYDPETQTQSTGIFDTVEDESPAYIFEGNEIEVMPTGAMLAKPGLVTVDVAFFFEGRQLSTFDFEFYVNRAAADGTEPQAQSFYRVTTLDAINAEFDALRSAIEALGGGEYLSN